MSVVRRVDVTRDVYRKDGDSVQAPAGSSFVGFNPEHVTKVEVEEEIGSWKDASHIHGWFVDNVQKGQDDNKWHCLSRQDIEKLLEVCEKVLNTSHLVWEPAFKAKGWRPIRQRAGTRGGQLKTMKNISIAHKLLPIKVDSRWDGPTAYADQYLDDIRTFRDWTESTLLKEERGELNGELYYRGC